MHAAGFMSAAYTALKLHNDDDDDGDDGDVRCVCSCAGQPCWLYSPLPLSFSCYSCSSYSSAKKKRILIHFAFFWLRKLLRFILFLIINCFLLDGEFEILSQEAGQ